MRPWAPLVPFLNIAVDTLLEIIDSSIMEIVLRLEEEKDYQIVEDLTREAFWNVHFPGADEHFLVHHLRKTKEFVRELDFVATHDDKLVGNIMYARADVINNDRKHCVLTCGPVSVLPLYQNRGVGGKLINHTIQVARELGYTCIVLYGDPEYYKRFGFKDSKAYGIKNKEGKYPAALLVLELFPNALNGIDGIFDEGSAYQLDENEVKEFDKQFTPKEKGYCKAQDRFNELVTMFL
jgi:predicted N-acetyltransferase YhbS